MFELTWTTEAKATYEELRQKAVRTLADHKSKSNKSSKQAGLFKQVHKCVELLKANPKHTGLHTHEYNGLTNPYDPRKKVWEAYAQNKTPGAYRVFWCYGPMRRQITIIAITPHP